MCVCLDNTHTKSKEEEEAAKRKEARRKTYCGFAETNTHKMCTITSCVSIGLILIRQNGLRTRLLKLRAPSAFQHENRQQQQQQHVCAKKIFWRAKNRLKMFKTKSWLNFCIATCFTCLDKQIWSIWSILERSAWRVKCVIWPYKREDKRHTHKGLHSWLNCDTFAKSHAILHLDWRQNKTRKGWNKNKIFLLKFLKLNEKSFQEWERERISRQMETTFEVREKP